MKLHDDFPWDVKRVHIDLGGDDDEHIEAMFENGLIGVL